MPPLREDIAEEFSALAQRLEREGKILSRAQLEGYYATFRQRFGPVVLADLDGEELLMTMHARGNKDSLAYWLEFKNDDEFPAEFGSISGGSAFNYGLYYSQDKGTWFSGSTTKPREITVVEAVEMARQQRNDLLAGAAILERFPRTAEDADYERLQRDLEEKAPTIQDKAWGHKYFSLLFPDTLDDFHNPAYAHFHLIKLLQLPPIGEGRYLNGGRFLALSRQFELPVNTICSILNVRDGRIPCTYWRIGTSEGTDGTSRWEMMKDGNCVAIGWQELGDLSLLLEKGDVVERRAAIRSLVKTHYAQEYHNNESTISHQAGQINNFLSNILVDDVVVGMNGATVLGIGKVSGGYYYRAEDDFPHQIPVDWLSHDTWKMDPPENLRTTLWRLGKHPRTLVEIESRIYGKQSILGPLRPRPPVALPPPLTGVPARVQAILERKGQVILYGPPGTGKTYWAEIVARELGARSWFKKSASQLTDEEDRTLMERTVRLCSFHPAYGYEDFLEGFRPELEGGLMTFQRRDGVFKRLCAEAEAAPDCAFYLIIDEINRGDIPRIFGELLTVLEKDKRGKSILLPLSNVPFHVPPNVFIIGTMNTADRSIALLDAALRRRFGFIELLPDSSTLRDTVLDGLPLRPWLDALNRNIVARMGRDGRNLQIGHSYFLTAGGEPVANLEIFTRVLEEDILPLLQEYFYDNSAGLQAILGPSLVDAQKGTVKTELFAPDRQEDLVRALIAPYPDIAAMIPPSEETDEDAGIDDSEGSDPMAPSEPAADGSGLV